MNVRAVLEHIAETDYPLVEGVAKAKEMYVKTHKIDQPVFDQLVQLDPTKQKKYIEWMSKAYLDTPELEKFKIIADFDKLVQKKLIKGEESNILKYDTIEKVYDKVKEFEDVQTKGEKQRREKMEGTDEIFENDNVLVLRINTEKASCYYGKGTKWCIAATQGSNYFKSYYSRDMVDFYFILSKKLPPENPLYKVAVAVYPNGELEAYNAPDEHLRGSDLEEFLKTNQIPETIFKHTGINIKRLESRIEGTYTVDPDGRYVVTGNVNLSRFKFGKLPLKFKSCTGKFDCHATELTTLEGVPEIVGEEFDCSNNKLVNLLHGPKSVGTKYNCIENSLESLEGAPEEVQDFVAHRNQLTSLKGSPKKVKGFFDISGNKSLTSLEGGPAVVLGDYQASECGITSLVGMPKVVGGSVELTRNKIQSLKGGPEKVGGHFEVSSNHELLSLEGAPKFVAGNFEILNTGIRDYKGKPRFIGGQFLRDR